MTRTLEIEEEQRLRIQTADCEARLSAEHALKVLADCPAPSWTSHHDLFMSVWVRGWRIFVLGCDVTRPLVFSMSFAGGADPGPGGGGERAPAPPTEPQIGDKPNAVIDELQSSALHLRTAADLLALAIYRGSLAPIGRQGTAMLGSVLSRLASAIRLNSLLPSGLALTWRERPPPSRSLPDPEVGSHY